MNDDSILMNNLCCLLNAIPFDGCSVICVPRSHTDSVVDCLDHGEEYTELHIECTSECTELCIHSSVVQIKEMNHFVNAEDVDTYVLGECNVITADGTTNSNKGPVILSMWQYALTGMGKSIHSLLQMEWYQVHIEGNHPASATPFAASANTYAHHATVGKRDSVSSMSAVTWEPAAVKGYEESADFSIALTLDTNGVSKSGLDIIGADAMVTSLAIEREACVISSITDQVPFLEYEDLCKDV